MSTHPASSANTEGSTGTGLSRRTLIAAGVWSAPVIALATAAPASAVSFATATVANNGYISAREFDGAFWAEGNAFDQQIPANSVQATFVSADGLNPQLTVANGWSVVTSSSTTLVVTYPLTGNYTNTGALKVTLDAAAQSGRFSVDATITGVAQVTKIRLPMVWLAEQQ